jgi:hypothetical protein
VLKFRWLSLYLFLAARQRSSESPELRGDVAYVSSALSFDKSPSFTLSSIQSDSQVLAFPLPLPYCVLHFLRMQTTTKDMIVDSDQIDEGLYRYVLANGVPYPRESYAELLIPLSTMTADSCMS